MVKLQTIFRMRVVYKSGYTHDFDCTSFTINGGRYEWAAANDRNKPLLLGADDIAAIWQLSHRMRLQLR